VLGIKDLPYPDAAYHTRWHSNPLSFGSYTFVPPMQLRQGSSYRELTQQKIRISYNTAMAAYNAWPGVPPVALTTQDLKDAADRVRVALQNLKALHADTDTVSQNVIEHFKEYVLSLATGGAPPAWVFGTVFTVPPAAPGGLFFDYRAAHGQVYFAGEGTMAKRYGYVDGAYISGVDAANAVLNNVANPGAGLPGIVGSCDEVLPADPDTCECPTGRIYNGANPFGGIAYPPVSTCMPTMYVHQARFHHYDECAAVGAPGGVVAPTANRGFLGAADPNPAAPVERRQNRLSFEQVGNGEQHHFSDETAQTQHHQHEDSRHPHHRKRHHGSRMTPDRVGPASLHRLLRP